LAEAGEWLQDATRLPKEYKERDYLLSNFTQPLAPALSNQNDMFNNPSRLTPVGVI
jgi:hypothetical protein